MGAHVRTARKLLLGREIAHMISVAGISQTEAASLIETSQSRIAGLINGTGNITVGDLDMLAERLGFSDPGYKETLQGLRRDSHKRGFWSTGHNRAYEEDLRLLVDLEKHTDQIRNAELEVVPGLLQTEDYVRAMFTTPGVETGEVTENSVRARLARQEILDSPSSPALHYVLSESCLRRMWSPDAALMQRQVEHLIDVSLRDNVMVQVLPFTTPLGRRATIFNRFTWLRVPSPGAAGPLEIVYVENYGEFRYLDDKKALAAYDNAWARLTSVALSCEDSRAFMREVVRDYKEI